MSPREIEKAKQYTNNLVISTLDKWEGFSQEEREAAIEAITRAYAKEQGIEILNIGFFTPEEGQEGVNALHNSSTHTIKFNKCEITSSTKSLVARLGTIAHEVQHEKQDYSNNPLTTIKNQHCKISYNGEPIGSTRMYFRSGETPVSDALYRLQPCEVEAQRAAATFLKRIGVKIDNKDLQRKFIKRHNEIGNELVESYLTIGKEAIKDVQKHEIFTKAIATSEAIGSSLLKIAGINHNEEDPYIKEVVKRGLVVSAAKYNDKVNIPGDFMDPESIKAHLNKMLDPTYQPPSLFKETEQEQVFGDFWEEPFKELLPPPGIEYTPQDTQDKDSNDHIPLPVRETGIDR